MVTILANRCPYSMVVCCTQCLVQDLLKEPSVLWPGWCPPPLCQFQGFFIPEERERSMPRMVQGTPSHPPCSSHCLSSLPVPSLCPPASVYAWHLGLGISSAPALCQTWSWILGIHSFKCTRFPLKVEPYYNHFILEDQSCNLIWGMQLEYGRVHIQCLRSFCYIILVYVCQCEFSLAINYP